MTLIMSATPHSPPSVDSPAVDPTDPEDEDYEAPEPIDNPSGRG